MRKRDRLVAVLVCAPVLALCACGGNGLPDQVTIQLPDGTEVQTTLGSGVLSFADSLWEFVASNGSGQGIPFVTVRFGPNGELAAFEDNTLAANILGTTILFDGNRHPTAITGVTYAAATFGAQTADARGFTFEGRFTAFAAGIQAANGIAVATGEFDGEGVDTIRGVFTFTSRVTLLDIPEGNQDLEIDYIGRRLE